MNVKSKLYGQVKGRNIYEYTLENENGIQLACINYGCIVTKIMAPDRNGNFENVVLCFDNLEDYAENNSPYLGGVVGRVAGRIKGGEFQLQGQNYSLAKNENGNHLHGGQKGFNAVIWSAEIVENEQEAGVIFTYVSPDGEEGYPGEVSMKITYMLNSQNEWTITYQAESDQTTLLNVTNHTYFNLSGDAKRLILDHTLQLDSHQFLPLNEQLLPTGEIRDVENTPFDFRASKKIRHGLDFADEQINLVGGYDHPFIINSHHKEEIILSEQESGRRLTVETDEVGVVVYTSNSLTEDFVVNGRRGSKHLGICLETQGLPDAVHHPNFPSIMLPKGDLYSKVTKYTFSVEEK